MEISIKQYNMYTSTPKEKWYTTYEKDNIYYLYCGRPSKFGNPFQGENNVKSIKQFNTYFTNNRMIQKDLLEVLKTLPKHITEIALICFCHPKPCHTDIYKKFLENYMSELNDIPKLYQTIKYNNIKCNGIKFSPSGLATYRRNPREWYNNIIKGIKTFKGNKASIYGTCVHYLVENFSIALSQDTIQNIVDEKLLAIAINYATQQHTEYNVITADELQWIEDTLHKYYERVKQFMIEDYQLYEYLEIETSYKKELKIKGKNTSKQYWLAGTIDALVKNRETGEIFIRDYKTSSMTKKSIDAYLIQLESYNFLIKKDIVGFQVVNIVPLKTKMNINYLNAYSMHEDRQAFKKLMREIVIVTNLADTKPVLTNYLFREGTDFTGKVTLTEDTK